MDRRNRALWIIQWVFSVVFILAGVVHFIVPDGLPGPMSWMYDLSDPAQTVAGIAEILGGLGLILPGLTKISPGLTVFAAAGLTLVMVGAAARHLSRGEVQKRRAEPDHRRRPHLPGVRQVEAESAPG